MDHLGHDHAPGEGHDHGHDHGHGLSDYYLEQLVTVFICGGLGLTAVLSYTFGRLDVILVRELRPWVLAGGVLLLLATAVRAVSLWRSVAPAAHDHGHDEPGHVHGPDCGHDHSADDHGHMPGGIYLKTIPLTIPLILFVMGLPNSSGFSQENIERRLGKAEALGEITEVSAKDGDTLTLDFAELNMAAYDPGKREAYEGRKVRVKGQLKKVSEKEYELFKLKMTCCAADMIPLKARIRSDIVVPQSLFREQEWVSVEGVLQFVDQPEKKTVLPVIRIGRGGSLGLSKTQPEA